LSVFAHFSALFSANLRIQLKIPVSNLLGPTLTEFDILALHQYAQAEPTKETIAVFLLLIRF
jgi:hypothetical protein